MIDLDAVQARADAATPGPWTHEQITPGSDWWFIAGGADLSKAIVNSDRGNWRDAEFIAHARTDIPFLLDRVRELEAAAALRSDYDAIRAALVVLNNGGKVRIADLLAATQPSINLADGGEG